MADGVGIFSNIGSGFCGIWFSSALHSSQVGAAVFLVSSPMSTFCGPPYKSANERLYFFVSSLVIISCPSSIQSRHMHFPSWFWMISVSSSVLLQK